MGVVRCDTVCRYPAAKKIMGDVRKQARIGSRIISDQANATLTELLKDVARARQADADYDSEWGAISSALNALKGAARADLRTYVRQRGRFTLYATRTWKFFISMIKYAMKYTAGDRYG
jgi:hypothetical protein